MRKLAATLTTILLLAALVLAFAAPASAQYVNGPETCGVNDVTIVPGQTITVTGSGYPPNSEVTITIGGVELGTVTTDDSGGFSQQFVVPAGLGAGSYSIGCTDVEGKTIGNHVTVVGGAVAAGTAFTGTSLNVPLWTVLVAGLFAAGVAFVALGYRRRAGVHRA